MLVKCSYLLKFVLGNLQQFHLKKHSTNVYTTQTNKVRFYCPIQLRRGHFRSNHSSNRHCFELCKKAPFFEEEGEAPWLILHSGTTTLPTYVLYACLSPYFLLWACLPHLFSYYCASTRTPIFSMCTAHRLFLGLCSYCCYDISSLSLSQDFPTVFEADAATSFPNPKKRTGLSNKTVMLYGI